MKAWVKGIIAGAVIAAIGVIVLIAGLYMNGWKYPTVEYNFEMLTYSSENADVKGLLLDVDLGPVKTEFYEGDTVSVEYPVCDVFSYSVTENNGTLEVKTDRKKFNWHWFSWQTVNIPTLTVKLPENKIYDLQILLDAGSVTVSDGTYGNIKMNIDAGTFNCGNIMCGDFNIDLDARYAESGNVICDGFSANVDAGTITAKAVSANNMTCELDAGLMEINNIRCAFTSVKVSAGKLAAGFEGGRTEYNINVNKSAGSCNVETQVGSTDKTINLRISAGKAELNFA